VGSWFEVEKIDNLTYAISEYGHPEKVHSYLLIGTACAALIDTGLGIGKIKEITNKLTSLPITVITTHAHWDHIGGHGAYNDICIHKDEASWLRDGMPRSLEEIREYVNEGPLTRPFPEGFDVDSYFPFQGEPNRELADDDVIDLGARKLRIIHTPGHSPGHVCVLDESCGYLFTGDLLYMGTLYAFLPESDPITYCRSVQKVSELHNLTKILPAHNTLEVDSCFILAVLEAFSQLERSGQLEKGRGICDFSGFKIHL